MRILVFDNYQRCLAQCLLKRDRENMYNVYVNFFFLVSLWWSISRLSGTFRPIFKKMTLKLSFTMCSFTPLYTPGMIYGFIVQYHSCYGWPLSAFIPGSYWLSWSPYGENQHQARYQRNQKRDDSFFVASLEPTFLASLWKYWSPNKCCWLSCHPIPIAALRSNKALIVYYLFGIWRNHSH